VPWLEPNPEVARNLEQVDAVAEQDRGEVDDDLVEKALLKTLPGDAGPEQSDAPAFGRILRSRHRRIDRLIDESTSAVPVRT
jgi:hypothetical protein